MDLFLENKVNCKLNRIGFISQEMLPLTVAADVKILSIEFSITSKDMFITTDVPARVKGKTIVRE